MLHYFFFYFQFSVCGFDNAATFETIGDEEIKYVEEYTQNEIPKLILLNQDETDLFTQQQQKIFFGMFASDPKKFEYTLGNKKFIKLIVKSVKDAISNTENRKDGLALFNKKTKTSWWKDLCRTPLGLFYGDVTLGLNSISSTNGRKKKKIGNGTIDVHELKNNLFNKTNEILKKYKSIKLKPLRDFTEDSVTVEILNGVSVKGEISCNFCDANSLVKNVKLFYQKTNISGYWVTSNLKKHFSNHHISNIHDMNSNHERDDSHLDDFELPIIAEDGNTSIELKIEPVFINENAEDILFSQMSKQNIAMVNSTLTNEERILDFHVKMELDNINVPRVIKICRIRGDGSCLFGSLSHQLYHLKINSTKHQLQTKTLRQESVDHIRLNLTRFLPYLKGRVIEQCDKSNINVKDINMEEECAKFLSNSLPQYTTYGGTESILALSEIYKTNIVTITDDGSCHLCHRFDFSYERTVCIAYRNNIHYDSVVEIDAETLSEFAQKMTTKAV